MLSDQQLHQIARDKLSRSTLAALEKSAREDGIDVEVLRTEVLHFMRAVEAAAAKSERERIAKHFEKMADDFASEKGVVDPDTGTLEFGNEEAHDYHSGLCEHAEDIRAMQDAS